ncbi:B3/4 domain-containing protein [Craterilacuibacter sp. RT1T]|uniref:B3/B4 domain-containing protein n=1 Tax=Craterilacuibacter sp. RT1T TaxID=2942211 RepID=UPI0020C03E25|nr:B3/4 domain-containing protein [Craterilacuibacter sp. RT1T]MCL6264467.1 B3/4 domain-containing protein [Craterilacuibacter sp. RT1T]
MFKVTPSIDPAIALSAPGFQALSLSVSATPIIHPEVAAELLTHACVAVRAGEPAWAEAHLAAWDNVFRLFGAKPQRTPCSASALRKRVLRDGLLPSIDPVVDLYNAISLQYAVPVGGENFSAYVGSPRLTIADGSERFDTQKDGVLVDEHPEVGEVVWRDEFGVTCRRWNWRQGGRTRLDAKATQMWFILESLPEMPQEALLEAGASFARNLQIMMPGATVSTTLIGISQV